jgi:ABC-type bacteriocin/lantibiotic exporter with double-glycine peptidase domain
MKQKSKIKLDVPLVAQVKPNSCWNASSNMIWLYSQGKTGRQGPMNTHQVAYDRADVSGITPQEFVTLARNVGMAALPLKTTHTDKDLFQYLSSNGPIWCAGYWFGFGHIIVLTGVDAGTVYFNDPDGGVAKEGTSQWFNAKLASAIDGCLMYKDAGRY